MKIKIACLAAVSMAISACATSGELIPPNLTRVDMPVAGDVTTVRLGESMVKKSRVYAYDAIELLEEFKAGDGVLLQKITIPPQKLKAKRMLKNNILYMAEEAYSSDALLGTRNVPAGICIPKDEAKKKWRVYLNGVCTAIGKTDLPKYETSTAFDVDKPSLTRELVYNGRVGDDVKIIYRELSNDFMRPAFQQDLQYDMGQSSEIAFREVEIDVVDADNQEITYVVLQPFKDLE